MIINTIIVDDFLENPMWVRQSAMAALDYAHPNKAYPGVRTDKTDPDYRNYVKQKLEDVLSTDIVDWENPINYQTGKPGNPDSSAFQLCTEGVESWVHIDPYEWTAILYLSPDAPVDSGTNIWRHKETGVYSCTTDEEVLSLDGEWEVITSVGNVFNRLVLFRGNLCHRSGSIAGFGTDKNTGRLTQTFFFNTTLETGKNNG
jgi:hypothetical protein